MVTKDTMLRWVRLTWAYENIRCFGGVLPYPTFHVSYFCSGELASWAGGMWTNPGMGRHHVLVNMNMVESWRVMHPVLVHEMIHQLQFLQRSKRTRHEHHGRFFQRHAERIIRDHGVPVTIHFVDRRKGK